jgi:hypothetical protein
MNRTVLRLRQYLLLHGPSPAREIYRSLEISQPSFSVAVKKMGPEIVVLGARRSARYALARSIADLPAEIPLYFISEAGQAEHAADLIAIQPRGFFVRSQHPAVRTASYPDLPYWLDDIRPSGFLGRLIPRRYPELNFPNDIRLWNSAQVLRYVTALGRDLIGNVVVGDHALELVSQDESLSVDEDARQLEYPRIAADTIQYGVAGSSAGGEQAKFLAVKQQSNTPVLVKFSPLGSGAITIRRRNLLVCEHLALATLRDHGRDAAVSEVISTKDQTFLESVRFDRVGARGRRGVMTLSSLSAQFSGELRNWREAAKDLERRKVITPEMSRGILWRYYFGQCIANSDMHAGNLSFFTQGEEIHGLAPIYDMLPMAYAPRQEQILPFEIRPPTFYPQEREVWQSAVEAARDFWSRVEKEKGIEAEIRDAAGKWGMVLGTTQNFS